MLYLDLLKICSNKGIEDPRRWLVKNGFSQVAASRMIKPIYESINYATLEKLCILLHCTPSDLMSWQPKEGSTIPDNHPLQQMKRQPPEKSINKRLKTLPPEKLAALQQFLDTLELES